MVDKSNISKDVIGELWDRPWGSEEMYEKRRAWSLAGDAGLLKYLQYFQQDLSKRMSTSEDNLSNLLCQLNESAVLIENVTNTSLALANTQFIESKVQEDDVSENVAEEQTNKDLKNEEYNTTQLIASVNEKILQGLQIMEEKYMQVQVVGSDTEDEADVAVSSIILKAKDPYHDRPLAFIIKSDKWTSSNKIGLEYSSSDTDQLEDGNEESWSEDEKEENVILNNIRNDKKNSHEQMVMSSESSDSIIYHVDQQHLTSDMNNCEPHFYSEKSQDILNANSEPTTPSSVLPKNQQVGLPNFAEELANRLGKVNVPFKNSEIKEQGDGHCITEGNEEDGGSCTSENSFSESTSLFKNDFVKKPTFKNKSPLFYESEACMTKNKTNVIPSYVDVPPPISNISVKPKSSIDDMFENVDSEDSDSIFTSSKSTKVSTQNQEESNLRLKMNFSDDVPFDSTFTSKVSTTDMNAKKNVLLKLVFYKKLINGTSVHNQENPLLENIEVRLPSTLHRQPSDYLNNDITNYCKIDERDFHHNKVSSTMIVEDIATNVNGSSKDIRTEENVHHNATRKSVRNVVNDSNEFGSVDDIFGSLPSLSNNNKDRSNSNVMSIFDDSDSDDLFFKAPLDPRSLDTCNNPVAETSQKKSYKNVHSENLFDNDIGFPGDNDGTHSGNNTLFLEDEENTTLFDDILKPSGNNSVSQKQNDSLLKETFSKSEDKLWDEAKISSISEVSLGKQSLSIFDDIEEDLFDTAHSKSEQILSNIFDDNEELFMESPSPSQSKLHSNSPRTTELNITEKVKTLVKTKTSAKDSAAVNQLKFDDDITYINDNKTDHEIEREINVEDMQINKEMKMQDNNDPLTSNAYENKNTLDDDLSFKKSSIHNVESMKTGAVTITKTESNTMLPKQGNSVIVSGKIKNLMGKMGNLKMLSPTSTPPLWRKNEDKLDSDEKNAISGNNNNDNDIDGGDNSSSSNDSRNNFDWITQNMRTSLSSCVLDEVMSQHKQNSVSSEVNSNAEDNAEVAVSFDEPVRIESLSSNASKNRARIQAKRRPQSRHARQSALRHSGIDFSDMYDAPYHTLPNMESEKDMAANTILKASATVITSEKDSNIFDIDVQNKELHEQFDDVVMKSEEGHAHSSLKTINGLGTYHLSKENSLNINHNPLLSPSTDEEDLLLDMPSDFLEDPLMDDLLFEKAPVLSPIANNRKDGCYMEKE